MKIFDSLLTVFFTKYSKKGFSMIELLVVIALTVVIAGVTFPMISKFMAGNELEAETREMASRVREVKNNSITQRDGKRWGVRFENVTGGTDKYEIFTGDTYVSSSINSTHFLSSAIEFNQPTEGDVITVQFDPVNGRVTGGADTTIILNHTGRSGLNVDNSVEINSQGVITVKKTTE